MKALAPQCPLLFKEGHCKPVQIACFGDTWPKTTLAVYHGLRKIIIMPLSSDKLTRLPSTNWRLLIGNFSLLEHVYVYH